MSDDNVHYPPRWARPSSTPLETSGGGGDSTGMEPWQQSVENRLGGIGQDIRDLRSALDARFLTLMAAFGAGFIVLGGMVIVGYLRLADAIAALPHH